MKIGAWFKKDGSCDFTLWAPLLNSVELEIYSPRKINLLMERDEQGYWRLTCPGLSAGASYAYRWAGRTVRPDPASFFQPQGVHQPSAVVDHDRFIWGDAGWKGLPLEEMIIYELHIGTFTPEGTFDAVIGKLEYLQELGINAVEIMPVAQFPGERNWGYDGVYPFAAQNSYGGPDGLKRLVDACHRKGVAVILDVVYNHLGPEGNYLPQFAPYFTKKYTTPWGSAVNFDGQYSFGVRDYFIENALYWLEYFHVDALRLDAIHGIFDFSAKHIWEEMSGRVQELARKDGRPRYLIAESDLNDVRVIRPPAAGGYGLDAQWLDDFHHSLHTLLTKERAGYYQDFGTPQHLLKSYQEGMVYSWQYSPFRKRYFGSSSRDIPAGQFIVFSQNHDQVGNRMMGERLAQLLPFEALKLTAGAVLLSPYVPMLFMGEEYAEPAPFLYFISHEDKRLIQAVREGRQHEFKSFAWKGVLSDPQDEETFRRSKLKWELLKKDPHASMRQFYKRLIQLRKTHPVLRMLSKVGMRAWAPEADKNIVCLWRVNGGDGVLMVMNFSGSKEVCRTELPAEKLKKIFDSADKEWRGPGTLAPEGLMPSEYITLQPQSFVLYEKRGG